MWDTVQPTSPPTYLSNAVSPTHWFRPLSPIDIQVIHAFDHLFRTIYRACLMLGLVEMNEVQNLWALPVMDSGFDCKPRHVHSDSHLSLHLISTLRRASERLTRPGCRAASDESGIQSQGPDSPVTAPLTTPVFLCVSWSGCLHVFHENRLVPYADAFCLFFPTAKVNWSKRLIQSKEVFGEKQKKEILSNQVDLVRESMK